MAIICTRINTSKNDTTHSDRYCPEAIGGEERGLEAYMHFLHDKCSTVDNHTPTKQLLFLFLRVYLPLPGTATLPLPAAA